MKRTFVLMTKDASPEHWHVKRRKLFHEDALYNFSRLLSTANGPLDVNVLYQNVIANNFYMDTTFLLINRTISSLILEKRFEQLKLGSPTEKTQTTTMLLNRRRISDVEWLINNTQPENVKALYMCNILESLGSFRHFKSSASSATMLVDFMDNTKEKMYYDAEIVPTEDPEKMANYVNDVIEPFVTVAIEKGWIDLLFNQNAHVLQQIVIRCDSVKLLQKCQSVVPFDEESIQCATWNDSINCMTFLHETLNVPFHTYTVEDAANNGSIRCFEYALLHGAPLREKALFDAILAKRWDIAKRLSDLGVENVFACGDGYDLLKETVSAECLEYLVNNVRGLGDRIRNDKSFTESATQNKSGNMVEYLIKLQAPWSKEGILRLVESNKIVFLKQVAKYCNVGAKFTIKECDEMKANECSYFIKDRVQRQMLSAMVLLKVKLVDQVV